MDFGLDVGGGVDYFVDILDLLLYDFLGLLGAALHEGEYFVEAFH